ncbi:hypothetical protein BVY01_01750 [bacterium I07]|nr:hypothetical protein BVY01_01750 [bacterium I07]
MRSAAIVSGSGFLAAFTNCRLKQKKTKRPNVVLVMTDDQGYGDLGCHGNTEIDTPNLDQLYNQSVRFTQFHVGPTCSPTRASLLTGRYCNRTGVWHTVGGRSLLGQDEVTIADLFSHNGYRTGIFGKWHLGDNFPFRPMDRGFKETIVHNGGAIGNAPDYWDNNYFDDVYRHNGVRKKFAGYCTDVWFSEAVKFISEHAASPFFCYIPTNAPHLPVNVPEKYTKPYRDNGISENRARFYGMVTNIDENMGRLISHVEQLGLEKNTIMIFLTDNGSAEGLKTGKLGYVNQGFSAGQRGKKGSEYDGGHRVPFFIYWPEGGIQGGKDVKPIAAHIDVLPTLVDLCDLDLPGDIQFDGLSLKPLIEHAAGGAERTGKDTGLSESGRVGADKPEDWPDRTLITDSQRVEHPIKWRKSAVMTDRWRLVNGEELYDIQTDPEQRIDVAGKFPNAVQKLRSDYDTWWKSVSPRFGEEPEIILGTEHENPALLTCHDWHSIDGVRQAISGQVFVRRGDALSGYWAAKIARAGSYEITLRRWPEETGAAIREPLPGVPVKGGAIALNPGMAIKASHARLSIGGQTFEKSIPPGAAFVKFKVKLKSMSSKLQTWLIDRDSGETRGAYFVYVEYKDDATN